MNESEVQLDGMRECVTAPDPDSLSAYETALVKIQAQLGPAFGEVLRYCTTPSDKVFRLSQIVARWVVGRDTARGVVHE